jgi:hypothetical protein
MALVRSLALQSSRRGWSLTPHLIVLEQTILAEHALVQALEKVKEPANLYINDSPDHLAFPPGIERSTVNYAREQLVRASQPKSAGIDAQSSVCHMKIAIPDDVTRNFVFTFLHLFFLFATISSQL